MQFYMCIHGWHSHILMHIHRVCVVSLPQNDEQSSLKTIWCLAHVRSAHTKWHRKWMEPCSVQRMLLLQRHICTIIYLYVVVYYGSPQDTCIYIYRYVYIYIYIYIYALICTRAPQKARKLEDEMQAEALPVAVLDLRHTRFGPLMSRAELSGCWGLGFRV